MRPFKAQLIIIFLMQEQYLNLTQQAQQLLSITKDLTANMANLSALVYQNISGLNWAGFYLLKEDKLVLGPFQGKPACVLIALGKGVCGTAAQKKQTVVVQDVCKFKGHIACDSASNSEIVVPLFTPEGKLYGVMDIDSPLLNHFGENEKQLFETLAQTLTEKSF